MTSLRNAVAFVTGGASGLGRATVERLIKQGVRGVLAFDRSAFEPNELTRSNSDRLITFEGDVTSEDEVKQALKLVEKRFGRLDLAVNCAGVGFACRLYNGKKDVVHPLEIFNNVLQVNTLGTFNVNRLASQLISRNEPESGLRGLLVNTASIAAYDGQIGQTAYSASKGAIVGMTLPMARDLSSLGIRVCTIAPGIFDTPMLASLPDQVRQSLAVSVPCPKRLGHTDEFGQMVLSIWENQMLNGETIRLDGALRMQP